MCSSEFQLNILLGTHFIGTISIRIGRVLECSLEEVDYPTTIVFFIFRCHSFIRLNCMNDGTLWYIEVTFSLSGIFEYYIKYRDVENNYEDWKYSKKGYLMVEPRLSIGPRQLESIDEVSLLTLVPKWMGPTQDWDAYLELAQLTGYNMIHFVPLQKRGKSDSPYSISACLSLSDDLFNESSPVDDDEKYRKLGEKLKIMETKYGLLSMTDIVWNHVASDASWLHDHPEVTYNLEDCPYLRAAYELDQGLLEFSRDLETLGLSSQLRSYDDLEVLLRAFQEIYLPKLRLWEFWVIDVSGSIESLQRYLTSEHNATESVSGSEGGPAILAEKSLSDTIAAQALYKDQNAGRFCHKIDLFKTARILKHYHGVDEAWDHNHLTQACASLRSALDYLNWFAYRQYDDDVMMIVKNIRDWVRYERLEARLKPSQIDES